MERHYRSRLNNHFSSLLKALPQKLIIAEVVGSVNFNEGMQEKRVSKGEIMELAKMYIGKLERIEKELEMDKKVLVENMERLKLEWTGMGGDILP